MEAPIPAPRRHEPASEQPQAPPRAAVRRRPPPARRPPRRSQSLYVESGTDIEPVVPPRPVEIEVDSSLSRSPPKVPMRPRAATEGHMVRPNSSFSRSVSQPSARPPPPKPPARVSHDSPQSNRRNPPPPAPRTQHFPEIVDDEEQEDDPLPPVQELPPPPSRRRPPPPARPSSSREPPPPRPVSHTEKEHQDEVVPQDEEQAPENTFVFSYKGPKTEASVVGYYAGDKEIPLSPAIPFVVQQCIKYFQENEWARKEEGLFRVSGSKAHIVELDKQFRADALQVNLSDVKEAATVCGLLKLVLSRSLDPVVHPRHDKELIAAVKAESLDAVHKVVITMSPPGCAIFPAVVRLLSKIVSEPGNKMKPGNIATSVAMTIFPTMSSTSAIKVLKFFVIHVDDVWPPA